MKFAAVLLCVACIISGCNSGNRELERGMELRTNLLEAEQCTFDAEITADYGDKLCVFSMHCQGTAKGNIAFTVTEPDSISGITGEIAAAGGKLTFDGMALQFDAMADDQITPVSAPWIFYNTLRGGYLTSAGMEEDWLRLTIHDSYEDDALQLDIWLDQKNTPVRAEFLHENRRIITMNITNFDIL